MSIPIDTADAGYPPEARALLDSLDDSTFISLGVLFGTDLCALGATKHPSCWEPLKTAWHLLDENERDRLTHSSSQSLRDRHLITEPSPGRGVEALIVPPRYRVGAKLRITQMVGRADREAATPVCVLGMDE
jgi:hypothetical protein